MRISLRIKELIFNENLSISAFEKKIGAGTAVITKIMQRDSNVSGDILQKILTAYPNIDANWLIMGRGSKYINYNHSENNYSMAHEEAPSYGPKNNKECSHCSIKDETIVNLNDTISMYRERLQDCQESKKILESFKEIKS